MPTSEEPLDGPVGTPFQSVAVCVDGSDAAADAVELGKALAGADGEITLLHALETFFALGWGHVWPIPDDEWQEMGDAVFEKVAAHAPDAERRLLPGSPYFAISQWVDENQPDVVVVAAHSGRFARLTLGSTSSHFAYHLDAPVAIAHPDFSRPRQIARVAACVDGDDHTKRVLDAASRVSGAYGAKMDALYVVEDLRAYVESNWAPDPQEWQKEWRATMDEMLGHAECEQHVLEGPFVGPAIRDWAERSDVDLLTLAAHRGVPERIFLGGVAGYLAHHAPCDVLISR